jgi:TolB-like protein
LGLAALTALALGAGLSSAAAQAGSARPTIAVLSLENNSGDASQDFFAGGMTDEIASALTALGHRHCLVELRHGAEYLPDQLRGRTIVEKRQCDNGLSAAMRSDGECLLVEARRTDQGPD